MERIVAPSVVVSVSEVVEKHNYRRDPATDLFIHDEVQTGVWSVRLEGCSALLLPFCPKLKAGDKVRLIIETAG